MRVVDADVLINHLKTVFPDTENRQIIIDIINSRAKELPKKTDMRFTRTPDFMMGFNECLAKIDRDLDESKDKEYRKLVHKLGGR